MIYIIHIYLLDIVFRCFNDLNHYQPLINGRNAILTLLRRPILHIALLTLYKCPYLEEMYIKDKYNNPVFLFSLCEDLLRNCL